MSQPEPRSSLSIGIEWASRVSTVGLEFALPPLVGWYADNRAGTLPWLTLLGVLLGFGTGMTHILRIAREQQARQARPGKRD